jgi:hypothetical protein
MVAETYFLSIMHNVKSRIATIRHAGDSQDGAMGRGGAMRKPDAEVATARKVLGVTGDTDRKQVTSAFRRLARTTYPDLCADRDAAARFGVHTAAGVRANVDIVAGPVRVWPSSAQRPQEVPRRGPTGVG